MAILTIILQLNWSKGCFSFQILSREQSLCFKSILEYLPVLQFLLTSDLYDRKLSTVFVVKCCRKSLQRAITSPKRKSCFENVAKLFNTKWLIEGLFHFKSKQFKHFLRKVEGDFNSPLVSKLFRDYLQITKKIDKLQERFAIS